MNSPEPLPLPTRHLRGLPSRVAGLILACVLAPAWLPGSDLARRNDLAYPLAAPVDIDIQVLENEVHLEPAKKNAGLWWLCGGMIGYTIASEINQARGQKADQLAEELAELMNELDCQDALVQRFAGGLNPRVIPVIGEVRCTKVQAGGNTPSAPVGRSPELLSVQYLCALNEDFTALQVTMKAVVWAQPVPLPIDSMVEDQVRELTKYYQVFTYEVSLSDLPSTKDRMRRAGAWLSLGTENLRSRILSGMTLLADALAFDLGCPGAAVDLRDSIPAGCPANAPDAPWTAEGGSLRWQRSDNGEITIHDLI